MTSAAGLLSVLALSVAACGLRNGPKLEQPVGETHTTASSTGGARAQGIDDPSAAIVIALSDDVRHACNIPQEGPRTTSFDVDSARLRPRHGDPLKGVAACVVSGKLADRRIVVVGHTDPRGSASYNDQLGLYRAIAGKQYLVDLGVPAGRLTTESAGAREAKGSDPSTWALDRTIEIRIWRGPSDNAAP
jgi:peptidoglycan-associated lipoprotein